MHAVAHAFVINHLLLSGSLHSLTFIIDQFHVVMFANSVVVVVVVVVVASDNDHMLKYKTANTLRLKI